MTEEKIRQMQERAKGMLKEAGIVLLPGQICPEHLHPQIGDYPGKEETFRCRAGEVHLFVPGEPTAHPGLPGPPAPEGVFSVWHEVILRPGEQYTLREKTRHWFQAGDQGAIVSEFSTPSFDDKDIFTDPRIRRISNLSPRAYGRPDGGCYPETSQHS